MNIGRPRTSRGVVADHRRPRRPRREVFEAVANPRSPLLDTAMPALTRAADHAKLWLAIAEPWHVGNRSARRGAGRGVVSLAATSLITNQLAKRVWRRPRPSSGSVPLVRRRCSIPTSNSMPSGHSASAAAFAVGVGLESPPLGLALALLAGLVGFSRVATGAHSPGDVFAGFAIGAAIAVLGGRLVPPIVDQVADRRAAADRDAARPDGEGVSWWSTRPRAAGPELG